MFGVAADLFAQGVLFGGAFQRMFQQIFVDGFGDEVRRAEAQAFDGVIHVAVPGDHDHLRVGSLLPYPFEQGQPVHARHADVGDHDGERVGGERFQRFAGALGGVGVIAEILDQGPKDMADAGFVIDEQNVNGSVHTYPCVKKAVPVVGRKRPRPCPHRWARLRRAPRAG